MGLQPAILIFNSSASYLLYLLTWNNCSELPDGLLNWTVGEVVLWNCLEKVRHFHSAEPAGKSNSHWSQLRDECKHLFQVKCRSLLFFQWCLWCFSSYMSLLRSCYQTLAGRHIWTTSVAASSSSKVRLLWFRHQRVCSLNPGDMDFYYLPSIIRICL